MDYRDKIKAIEGSIPSIGGFVKASDILAADFPEPTSGDTWGNWTLDKKSRELRYRSGPANYEVDLDRCQSAAAVLDWLAQVQAKTWCSAEDAGNLLRAIDDVLHLQRNLCGGANWERPPVRGNHERARG